MHKRGFVCIFGWGLPPVIAGAILVNVLSAWATPASGLGRSIPPTDRGARTVVISVNGQSITRARYEAAVHQDWQRTLARFGTDFDPGAPELAALRTQIEAKTRERLTNWMLLLDAARSARIRISNDSVTQIWEEATSRFADAASLDSALRESGRTREEVRQDIRDNLMIDGYLQRRVGEITVSETEVHSFFEENRERYARPETVRARHILIQDTDAHARIIALSAQIAQGANFDELARHHSQDVGSGRNGGDLGFFERGRMVPEFESAAFALPVGQVSAPVQTQFGWHLIKVDEHRAAESADFEMVREDAARRVENRKRDEKVQALTSTLRRQATIRINLPPLPIEDSVPPQVSGSTPSPAPTVRYTCPMHREVVSTQPGRCSQCGMNLVAVERQVTH